MFNKDMCFSTQFEIFYLILKIVKFLAKCIGQWYVVCSVKETGIFLGELSLNKILEKTGKSLNILKRL